MFETIKQIFNERNAELRRRISYTLFVAAIFFAGKTIQVPGTVPISGDATGVFALMNVISGNSLAQVSIFALGVAPYITASIIIQLLSMDVLPVLTRLSQEGEYGRKRINQITRYTAIGMAILQGSSYALLFDKTYKVVLDPTPQSYLVIVITLTAGTAFVLWLADQITQKGVGNGVSLLIMLGIASSMPGMMKDAYNTLYTGGTTQEQLLGNAKFALFIVLYILLIMVVIYVQEGVRRVAIQYSNRSSSAYNGGGRNFIPLKINSAGVIPVIFASALLTAPIIVASILSYFFDTTAAYDWMQQYLQLNSKTGFVLYLVLIIMFTYFYTFIQVSPDKMAENLQKSGAYVPGIRPGQETSDHFTKILYRLTFFGSIFLAVIAGMPIVFANITNLPNSVRVGGTALLILVGVSLEMTRQIEQHVVGYDYEGYVTK